MRKKKNNPDQRKEIIWNIINSLLAGALVLVGAITDGKITIEGFMIATAAALFVAITQFKDYWQKEKSEYCNKKKIGSFICFQT